MKNHSEPASLPKHQGTGKAKEAVDEFLKELVNCTVIHNAAEEALLRKNSYPELSAHLAGHEALRIQVTAFQQQYAAGNLDMGGGCL